MLANGFFPPEDNPVRPKHIVYVDVLIFSLVVLRFKINTITIVMKLYVIPFEVLAAVNKILQSSEM